MPKNFRMLVPVCDLGLQFTSAKGHWSDIYVECNDQMNIIT